MPVLGFCQFIIAQEERCLSMLSGGPEINKNVIIYLCHFCIHAYRGKGGGDW
jgi:hypothetical protein